MNTGNAQGESGFAFDDLEPPSAGRSAKPVFKPVFTTDNPENPQFLPKPVAPLASGQLPIANGRLEVSLDMTNATNTDLTRLNRGYPIGIHFTALSRL